MDWGQSGCTVYITLSSRCPLHIAQSEKHAQCQANAHCTLSHHYQGSIGFNTVNTNCPEPLRGVYFLILPWDGSIMREWLYCTASSRDVLYPYTAGMYWVVHPRRPRDFPRPEGNLEVGGDVQPKTSRLEAVYGHSLIINPYLGMYQKIHPRDRRAVSIGNVKINTSLIMKRK